MSLYNRIRLFPKKMKNIEKSYLADHTSLFDSTAFSPTVEGIDVIFSQTPPISPTYSPEPDNFGCDTSNVNDIFDSDKLLDNVSADERFFGDLLYDEPITWSCATNDDYDSTLVAEESESNFHNLNLSECYLDSTTLMPADTTDLSADVFLNDFATFPPFCPDLLKPQMNCRTPRHSFSDDIGTLSLGLGEHILEDYDVRPETPDSDEETRLSFNTRSHLEDHNYCLIDLSSYDIPQSPTFDNIKDEVIDVVGVSYEEPIESVAQAIRKVSRANGGRVTKASRTTTTTRKNNKAAAQTTKAKAATTKKGKKATQMSEEKRDCHNQNERQRRVALAEAFFHVHGLIPEIACKTKVSKVDILRTAKRYMHSQELISSQLQHAYEQIDKDHNKHCRELESLMRFSSLRSC